MSDWNRPTRAPLPRPDDRDLGPADSGNFAQDGYRVLSRKPRVAGFDDLVEPERANRIEGIVRGYEDSMVGYDD